MTPTDLLAAALRHDPSRPLVTWYDDASGERVELSVATAANWAAKTANLLVEDGVDAVRLDPAWHWLAVVVALGAWTAGVPVGDEGEPLPGDPKDFVARVLPQPDALIVPSSVPDDLALSIAGRTWTLDALGTAAVQATADHGVEPGERVMSTLALDSVVGIDAGLLVPLAAGGSVVLVAHADESKLAKRAEDERVSRRLPPS